MQPFVGQRVELTGTMAPTSPSSSSATAATGTTGAATTPEFRVVSVRPLGGGCPPR
jgi:hypothetical protein